ncbi:serine/threonine protein phosphatase [Pseudohalocynthiibacter aestuariivivens]|nr:metallophosphoesterase family protein [Pseudohalocynthiibacter aestuariivivens]QIE45252.1 serine/threonine protein phosphatase [Pseudohalocynthiibacter aestuariivivens]
MPAFAPDRPLYVIGDVHGRADLIEPLLQSIDADVSAHGHTAPLLVFLGDYVDRGEHSDEVLVHLQELSTAMPDEVVCLMGNHEQMMLDFLDDPAGRGARWLVNGGLQTLASFRIGGLGLNSPVEDMADAGDALLAAMPAGMLDWLRTLPRWRQSGNVVCVHAAMNPARAPIDQDERAMLWGHRDFTTTRREDGLWVVHGHTIVKEPEMHNGRIAIDTGAYHSNRLTAAAITSEGCSFLQTS